MNSYKITVKGKGSKLGQGKTPQDAFSKVFPAVDLTATKNSSVATVCIELVGNKRKSCNYYIATTKTGTTTPKTITVCVRWDIDASDVFDTIIEQDEKTIAGYLAKSEKWYRGLSDNEQYEVVNDFVNNVVPEVLAEIMGIPVIVSIPETAVDLSDDDAITEYLSDKYGYCVRWWEYDYR